METMSLRHGIDYLVLVHIDDPASAPSRPLIAKWWIKVIELATGVCAENVHIVVGLIDPNTCIADETALYCATLPDAVRFLDTLVFSRFIATARPFSLLTDGPRGMAQLLALDPSGAGFSQLQPYLRNFLDLRVEFLKCFPKTLPSTASDRHSIAQYLRVPIENADPASAMYHIIKCLLYHGHVFAPQRYISAPHHNHPQAQHTHLASSHAPLLAPLAAPALPIGGIVRLRGLPWTATVDDVRLFFVGLSIAPEGIHFVLNAHGKVTGEAFMQVLSQSDVKEALRRHRQTMGRRYVEVFKSSSQEMIGMTSRMSTLDLNSLASKVITMAPPPPPPIYFPHPYQTPRHFRPGRVHPPLPPAVHQLMHARVRGLPISVTATEIALFFGVHESNVALNQTVSPARETRRFSEAVVRFDDVSGFQHALTRTGSNFDQNQIEVVRATLGSQPPRPTNTTPSPASVRDQQPPQQPGVDPSSIAQIASPSQDHASTVPNHPGIHVSQPSVSVVRMRGVPPGSQESDILGFFEGFSVRENGVVFGTDRVGRSSGDAWVSLVSPEQAEQAVANLNQSPLGNCPVELMLAQTRP